MFRWTLHNIDTGVIQKLTKDPRGYEDLTLTHKRDEKWHGVHYDFSNEFGFFCKGAGKELLDAAYDTKGQEATVKIKLEVKCNGSWTTMLNGKLDFSTYRQEYRDNVLYTFLNAQNENIVQLIRNREDLEVDILSRTSLDGMVMPFYPYRGYNLNMHSKTIRLTSEWENTSNTISCAVIPTAQPNLFHIAEWSKVKGELKESNDITPSFENFSVFDTTIKQLVEFDNSYVFPFNVTVTWNVAGLFTDRSYASASLDLTDCTGGTPSGIFRSTTVQNNPNTASAEGWILLLKIGQNFNDATGWILATVADYSSLASIYQDTFTSGGSQSITTQVNRGDKIWLMWSAAYSLSAGADLSFNFEYTVADISIVADTTTPDSIATAVGIHEAWTGVAEMITGIGFSFRSNFFGRTDSNIAYPADGCGSRVAITSGKNIRGFANSPILPSLKTMFDSCDAIWGIGLGVERYQNRWVLRVEEIDYFYSDTIVLTLNGVPNIQMKHRADLVYNEIQLGFKKWEIEADGGLDEPNTRINYAVPPIKSNKQKFEKLSDFVGGMYAIEFTRRKNHIDFTSEDTRYDEDVFFIALRNDDLTYCEKNENMQSVTGLISPETAYNLRFLLSSTFDRLKNQFVAGLTKLGTYVSPVVMPAQGEGNQTVTYAYVPNGCAGDHFGSVQVNGRDGEYPDAQARRDSPLWVPVEYTFDYPLSFSDYLNLVANPYGLILFSNSDTGHFSGWLLSVEYNVRRKSGSFTILASSGIETPDLVMDNTLGDYYFPDYNSGDYNT